LLTHRIKYLARSKVTFHLVFNRHIQRRVKKISNYSAIKFSRCLHWFLFLLHVPFTVVANRDGDGSGIKLLNNIFEIWHHHESSKSWIFFYFKRFQFLTFDSWREKKTKFRKQSILNIKKNSFCRKVIVERLNFCKWINDIDHCAVVAL
jgi:hypothetical protein